MVILGTFCSTPIRVLLSIFSIHIICLNIVAGEIEVDEMVDIFCLMYSVQVRTQFLSFNNCVSQNWVLHLGYPYYFLSSLQGYTEEEATERALNIFESLDKNGDGSLAEDEFIKASQKLLIIHQFTPSSKKGCLADTELLDLLNAGPGAE
jgi:hypothetical protein